MLSINKVAASALEPDFVFPLENVTVAQGRDGLYNKREKEEQEKKNYIMKQKAFINQIKRNICTCTHFFLLHRCVLCCYCRYKNKQKTHKHSV